MSEICLRLRTSEYSENKVIVSSDRKEADVILESFAALIATGKIKLSYLSRRFPQSKLFKETEEDYTDHDYDVVEDAEALVSPVPDIRKKSELLVQLEAAAETERTQPNDDLAAAE